MAREVRVVEDGVEERLTQRPSSGPSWVWLVVGFVVGLGSAVVFVNASSEPAPSAAEDASLPEVVETTPPSSDEQTGEAPVRTSGIADVVDGFPDTLVAVAQVGARSIEHVTWPIAGEELIRPMGGFASGSVRFDVSGRRVALTTGLPGSSGSLLSMGPPLRVRPVAADVTGYSWHDDDPGALAFTQMVDGELLLWEAGSSAEPQLITRGVGLDGRVAAWGAWGFALQGPDEITLLTSDGDLRTVTDGRVLDSDPSGWVVVSDGGLKLVSAGGGIRGLEISGLDRIGEVEGGRLSPDGDKLAIGGEAGYLIVSIDGEDEPVYVPVSSGSPQLAWSSDSRFVLAPWFRGVLIIDALQGGRSQIELAAKTVLAAATVPLTSR